MTGVSLGPNLKQLGSSSSSSRFYFTYILSKKYFYNDISIEMIFHITFFDFV